MTSAVDWALKASYLSILDVFTQSLNQRHGVRGICHDVQKNSIGSGSSGSSSSSVIINIIIIIIIIIIIAVVIVILLLLLLLQY